MRILGLDYGDTAIGVAVSDSLGLTAQGVAIIRRQDANSFKKSIASLKQIISEYKVEKIVLGYPKNLDNSEGLRCEKTVAFKERLERNFKRIPVILWDERLSTVAAFRPLREAGCSGDKSRFVIDQVAAVYILQGYLDYLRKEQGAESMDDLTGFDSFEDEDLEGSYETLIMTDEDGNELDFIVVDSAEDGGQTYLLVIEAAQVEEEDAEAIILRETKEENDEYVYDVVEDDAEFERVAALFQDSGDDYEIEK